MNIFINNAIQNGIQNYLKNSEQKNINKVHIFEYWVIKILVKIYGERDIINPYKLGTPNNFKKNLEAYGLTDFQVKEFCDLMAEYDNWLNSMMVKKTDIPSRIEACLINMLVLKATYHKISPEEIEFYNNCFDPIDNDMAKLHDLIVVDKTVIPRLWRIKRNGLEDGLILEEVEPILLPASDYKRYGLTINEVKELPHLKIKELNAKIKEEDEINGGVQEEFDPKKLILTSGSGFVDTIVLLSIIATQIFIGLLIAFSFIRR